MLRGLARMMSMPRVTNAWTQRGAGSGLGDVVALEQSVRGQIGTLIRPSLSIHESAQG